MHIYNTYTYNYTAYKIKKTLTINTILTENQWILYETQQQTYMIAVLREGWAVVILINNINVQGGLCLMWTICYLDIGQTKDFKTYYFWKMSKLYSHKFLDNKIQFSFLPIIILNRLCHY